ncbi:30856_t:CDS:2, partial [Gigaspora margarita]
IIEEAVCQEIQKSPVWSIMIDKRNMVIIDKNLAIISKHISKNLPIYHYLGMIELKERTADAIVNELNTFIQAKNLPINCLMNIESDGALLMLEHHSISHRLVLASENTASAVPYLAKYNDI